MRAEAMLSSERLNSATTGSAKQRSGSARQQTGSSFQQLYDNAHSNAVSMTRQTNQSTGHTSPIDHSKSSSFHSYHEAIKTNDFDVDKIENASHADYFEDSIPLDFSKTYSNLSSANLSRDMSSKLDYPLKAEKHETFSGEIKRSNLDSDNFASNSMTSVKSGFTNMSLSGGRIKKDFTGSKGPAYFHAADREFTFTGYDIMNDKPPDDAEDRPSTAERDRKKFEGIYCAMCRELDIIPVTFVKNRITAREIKISSRGLGPKGARAMAVALVNNRYVANIDLSDNDLQTEGVICISEMLSENTTITHLDLSENRIPEAGIEAICNAVAQHDILKVLKLSGTGCKDTEMLHIKFMLDTNLYLRELYLSHNGIGDIGCKTLRKALADNDTLEVLDLSWNHIRHKGAIVLAEGIRENRGLKTLNLSWNGFAFDGTSALAAALTKNKTLLELDLSSNRVHAESLTHLMKGLRHNNTLLRLMLGRNPLTPQAAYLMLQSLLSMSNSPLRYVNIWDIVVDESFLGLYDELKETRKIEIIHGPSLSYSKDHELITEANELANCDPRELLVKIMERDGLRVIDLFKRIDDDASWTVTRDEFKAGIQKHNLPVTEKQLDDLIELLDDDKNGEIDLRCFIRLVENLWKGKEGDDPGPEKVQAKKS